MLRTQVRHLHASARRSNFAKMSIVGRIGSDFTEYTSSNNNRYLKYSVASQPRRDGPTNWFNVTVFNEHQINFLTQYVRKGYVLRFAFRAMLRHTPLLTRHKPQRLGLRRSRRCQLQLRERGRFQGHLLESCAEYVYHFFFFFFFFSLFSPRPQDVCILTCPPQRRSTCSRTASLRNPQRNPPELAPCASTRRPSGRLSDCIAYNL